MIDIGLAVSVVAVAVAMWFAGRSWCRPADVFDVLSAPVMIGILVARLSALVLDSPVSLTRVSDIIVINGGVEFWPGVVAGLAVRWYRLGKAPDPLAVAIVPVALVGYGTFEAGCVLRQGCFGPLTSFGLPLPSGGVRMFPVGLVMGGTVIAAAWYVRRLVQRGHDPTTVVLVSLATLATVRAIGSVWLPHVGFGPTRQHLESVAVAAVSWLLVAWRRLRQQQAPAAAA